MNQNGSLNAVPKCKILRKRGNDMIQFTALYDKTERKMNHRRENYLGNLR